MHVLGLLGNAGSGKDTVAEAIAPVHLVKINGDYVDVRAKVAELCPPQGPMVNLPGVALRSGAIQIALADPMKEFCQQVYDFSILQLWGPSSERNKPDERYQRPCRSCGGCGLDSASMREYGYTDLPCDACSGTGKSYLTPREALQTLGAEWGRTMWPETWVRLALARAAEIAEAPPVLLTASAKYCVLAPSLAVISDCRFLNEARLLYQHGHEVWRIHRPDLDMSTSAYQHVSETEQHTQADQMSEFVTHELVNDGGLHALRDATAAALLEAGL